MVKLFAIVTSSLSTGLQEDETSIQKDRLSSYAVNVIESLSSCIEVSSSCNPVLKEFVIIANSFTNKIG
jgi:hypothetical protein